MMDRDNKHAIRRRRVATLVAAFLAMGGFAASAQAATYTVGTTSDTAPGTACVPTSGKCSLRELIEFENNLKPSATPDTINVPARTYGLANGALTITQSVSIVGAGARTTALQQFSSPTARVFDVRIPTNPTTGKQSGPVPSVSISGMVIEFGTATCSACGNDTGFGGDIRNQGTLTLSGDWVTEGTSAGGSGGGISNEGGTLTLTHSLVSTNFSNFNPCSCGGDSGGIQNFGPNPVTGTAGTLAVDNSTIANNNAALGGGIFSWGDAANTTSIVNSTIAYNSVDNTRGSTNGAGLLMGQGTLSIENSIVALNTVNTPTAGAPANCGGSGIASAGHNLESETDCGFKSAGDLQGTDPQFTSTFVQDNGGNTDTIGLHAQSPAVDAIPPASPSCKGTDQAGTPRPQGNGCDIGAFEAVQPVEGAPITFGVGVVSCGLSATPNIVINWGDGTSSPGNASADGLRLLGTHAYLEEGTFSGTVTYTPGDCPRRTLPFDVKVSDAALTAAPGSINAGAAQLYNGPVATFTDADPGGTASDYTATINWGDGTSSAGTVSGAGPFTVNGTHTYATGGSYPVSVSIADAGGATALANSTATVAPQAQPTLTPTAPLVTSTTSAAFATTVDPEGLATQVSFQYGPALPAARDLGSLNTHAAAPITYTASTPAETIGPDYSNHTVTTSVAGLLPNTTYHVRAVAANGKGKAVGPDQTLTTPADSTPPPPVLGKSVDAAPVSGLVLIKLPNGKPLYASDRSTGGASGLTKGTGFVPLTEARQLPSGTQIDARLGTINLVAATPQRHKTQAGDFSGGMFGFAQDRRGIHKGQTTLSLLEGLFPGAPSFSGCKTKAAADRSSPTGSAARVSSKILQALHASAHGHFRTRGRYAAATVRGTAWTTTDRCDGTQISVQRHTVAVTDFVRHISIFVHQGHSYLARAPRSRRK